MSSPKEAELTKLLENTFRHVRFVELANDAREAPSAVIAERLLALGAAGR